MKINLILLAAGNSRRFGSNKLLYDWRGRPLYRHLCDRLAALCSRCPQYQLFLVSQYSELLTEAQKYYRKLYTENDSDPLWFHTVYSPESRDGISYSVKNGVRASLNSRPESEAFAFFVADQPYLQERTVEDFLAAFEKTHIEKGTSLASVCYQSRMGNPTVFSSCYTEELLALTGDTGGRKILRRHPGDCFYFPVSAEEELLDADIPEDLEGHEQY